MKQVSVTVLVENSAQGHGLLAEHGLAFWIEIGPRRILFDAGQTDIVSHNAALLDIDLSSMDAMVLSHGHYDHTGGLPAIARSNTRREQGVVAYAHPRAMEDKYARNADGTGRYIGMAAVSFARHGIPGRRTLVEGVSRSRTGMPRQHKSGVAGMNMPGMSVCATQGGPRMAPIFGGMLMSGAKVAKCVVDAVKNRAEH